MRHNRGGSGRGGRRNQHGRGGGHGRRSHGNGHHRMHGGGGGRGRGPRGHHRGPRDAAISGNQRERIAVESGDLVFIDQFMLANPQFIEKIVASLDDDTSVKNQIVKDYGGCTVSLEPGTYKIERDPFAYSIVIHQEDAEINPKDVQSIASDNIGRVFVDTRCLAMVDRELLDDSHLLLEYQKLWFSGKEKACRDLLRDNGGAVRYGFQRYGDELGVYTVPEKSIVCLWPDVSEPEMEMAAGE